MIRIGIIGLGWWGKQIVVCLADSPRFKVVAGCDIDTRMAAPFAAANKFDLTDDYNALLARSDVDAVAVVTPHLLHEEMTVAALGAGKQVFCEKPLALTTASAERVIAAAAKAGRALGIGHERRFEPAMEEMRRLFESGALGRVLHLDANVSHNNFRKMEPGIGGATLVTHQQAHGRRLEFISVIYLRRLLVIQFALLRARHRRFSRRRRRISSALKSISKVGQADALPAFPHRLSMDALL